MVFQEWGEPHFRTINKFFKQNGHKGKASGEDRVFVASQSSLPQSQLSPADIKAALRLQPITLKSDEITSIDQAKPSFKRSPKTSSKPSQKPPKWLLRSMWVAKDDREKGLGGELLDYILDNCSGSIYCYPFDHLSNFYSNHGFNQLAPEEAPVEIANTYKRLLSRGEKVLLMWRPLR